MSVDIGFAEECESWQVESRVFPSKIGGKPAWLSLENIPKPEDLECTTCGKPMTFLCQVYAPYEEDLVNFHRTLFVFVCRRKTCCVRNNSDSVRVFRSNLPRTNKFYPSEPPKEGPDDTFDLSKHVTLCNLCGCFASKHCSLCKKTYYCCSDHQVRDWKNNHKLNCNRGEQNNRVNSKYLFLERELVIDLEEIDEESNKSNTMGELEKFKQMKLEGKTGCLNELSSEEIEEYAIEQTDKVFEAFKERIKHFSDQVLRYDRGGNPLWIANKPLPEDVPNCEHCGSPRQFEFQIMPQMLTVLKEIEIDWGVLCVYSCKNSCPGDSYKLEFVFKQDVSEN